MPSRRLSQLVLERSLRPLERPRCRAVTQLCRKWPALTVMSFRYSAIVGGAGTATDGDNAFLVADPAGISPILVLIAVQPTESSLSIRQCRMSVGNLSRISWEFVIGRTV